MKYYVTLLLSLFFTCNVLNSQVLFTENFAYAGSNGDSLTSATIGAAVWKAHSGGGNLARNVKFQTASLSFGGYTGSGIGGSVRFQHTIGSQDVNANIGTNVNSTSVYASFLLKIDSTHLVLMHRWQ